MKKVHFISFLLIILIFFSCDNIDDLNLIAGLGYFEMEIINPSENDRLEQGKDCLIKWKLKKERAKNVRIDLLKEGNQRPPRGRAPRYALFFI